MLQLRLNLKVPDEARACSTYVTSPSHSRMLCCGVSGNLQSGSGYSVPGSGYGVVTCPSVIIHQAPVWCALWIFPLETCLSAEFTPTAGIREPVGR